MLYLASERCDVSGVVVRAAGGTFGTAAWHAGAEIDAASAEELADRWHELEGAASPV